MSRAAPRYRLGIDVGGTFTDIVAVDPSGVTVIAKAPTTPDDPSIGLLDAIERVARRMKINPADLLAATERIVHGTTVTTNALLERKGARTGLLTTAGHRDVLEMREGLKEDRYNLRMPPPEPLVPRHLRLGVPERLRADGTTHTALDTSALESAVNDLIKADVAAVAVCYLHAYREPAHERATAEVLARMMPDAFVSLSSDVFPQIKEYERVSTTVVNAYVGPILARYLTRLEQRLKEAGFQSGVLIILSHGGVAPIDEVVRLAAGTVLSGPAGGVAGCRHAAKILGVGDLIPFDMGGTSTDISLIADGEPASSSERGLAGQRIGLPSLDIVSIGAGGGSIAYVDAGDMLHVGPRSAGAVPGPACYGRGGTEPTVTDANLVLGYLDAASKLGGDTALDADAAARTLETLAGQLGLDRMAAAAGVHRLINTQMAEGIRLVSVRRGVDPRRFALLSFGGAAGLHATAVARQLEMTRVLVPRVASVLSAWGMLASDLRFEVARTHIGDLAGIDSGGLRDLFGVLEAEGRARLDATGFDGSVHVARSAEMRYGEQIFEVMVSLEAVDWNATDLLAQVAEQFHQRHEALYTYAQRDQEVVLVNARVAVIGALPAPPQEPEAAAAGPGAPKAEREIYIDGWITVPVYDLASLAAGQEIAGPALVESETTTVLIGPGEHATTTPRQWLDIELGQ